MGHRWLLTLGATLDLKEIGMLAWVNRYHVEQDIPMRKLLIALGVVLVGRMKLFYGSS